MRDIEGMSSGNALSKSGITHYHEQLRLSDRGLVVCNNWDVSTLAK